MIEDGDEVYVDLPGTCVDGRCGIVVGWRDFPAVQKQPAERRYEVELFLDYCDLDDDPAQLQVIHLNEGELSHVTWRAN